MIDVLKPLLGKLAIFAKDRFGFEHPPRLFLKKDKFNSESLLGRTAHYDPAEKAVTIFISGRHPKDILRSFTHELVHHAQNLRGDLAPEKMKTMNRNYAQECPHMRKMEQEAYLEGNMCFRDWEDGLDDKLQYRLTIAEQKFLKENKKMSAKKQIDKETIKGLVTKLLKSKIKEVKDEEKSETSLTDVSSASCERHDGEGNIKEGGQFKKCSCSKKDSKKDSEQDSEQDDPDHAADDDKDAKGSVKAEGRTPEAEERLYESRFTPRNNKLFEKLMKKWAK
tara:strand:- start:1309 stop:2148 length:840 start_codon:yes stop_codon:yes gene_type:complete